MSESELELIVDYFVRIYFESMNEAEITVPIDLKKLITIFAQKFIHSSLMTTSEDIKFMQILLKTKAHLFENTTFKLLFKASRDGYSANSFHRICDNRGATICIIKSDHGNIFGGFTIIPWSNQIKMHFYFVIYIIDQNTI